MIHFLPTGLSEEYKNCCMHCLTDSNGALDEMRWCYQGTHEAPRHDFIFDDQEYSRCNECSKRENVTPPAVETLDNEAVPADHWKLIEKFNSELDKLERLACDICNGIGFDMGMKRVNDIN